jgi:hypothetical protein
MSEKSEKASALLFRWSLGGALAAILLLNFLDRVVAYHLNRRLEHLGLT